MTAAGAVIPATPAVPAGQALRTGANSLVRYWPLVLIFFAVNTCAAAAWTIPMQAALEPFAYHPGLWDADGGLPLRVFIEQGMNQGWNPEDPRAGPPPAAQTGSALALPAVLGGLLLAIAAGVLLPGGAILTYHERAQVFSLGRFVRGMLRWALPFLTLWLLELIVGLLAWVLGVFLIVLAAASGAGSYLALPALAVPLGVPFVFGMLSEYTRVVCVMQDRRNPLTMMRLAWRLLRARPLPLAGIYLLGPVLALAILLLYGNVLSPAAALAALPVMVAVQQLVIILRTLARLWRLASETAVMQPVATR